MSQDTAIFNKEFASNTTKRSLVDGLTQRRLTPEEVLELRDWFAHLPIQDELIRGLIAVTLNRLITTYACVEELDPIALP